MHSSSRSSQGVAGWWRIPRPCRQIADGKSESGSPAIRMLDSRKKGECLMWQRHNDRVRTQRSERDASVCLPVSDNRTQLSIIQPHHNLPTKALSLFAPFVISNFSKRGGIRGRNKLIITLHSSPAEQTQTAQHNYSTFVQWQRVQLPVAGGVHKAQTL